jgi:hypothetical protein
MNLGAESVKRMKGFEPSTFAMANRTRCPEWPRFGPMIMAETA